MDNKIKIHFNKLNSLSWCYLACDGDQTYEFNYKIDENLPYDYERLNNSIKNN